MNDVLSRLEKIIEPKKRRHGKNMVGPKHELCDFFIEGPKGKSANTIASLYDARKERHTLIMLKGAHRIDNRENNIYINIPVNILDAACNICRSGA